MLRVPVEQEHLTPVLITHALLWNRLSSVLLHPLLSAGHQTKGS